MIREYFGSIKEYCLKQLAEGGASSTYGWRPWVTDGESHAGFLLHGDKQNSSKQEQDAHTFGKKQRRNSECKSVGERRRVIADDESGSFFRFSLSSEKKRKERKENTGMIEGQKVIDVDESGYCV